ncbi:MAG: BON domain-containing protein [Anaerolineae bacterium]|nr:BON domain-containing protein [Anaerolineae bacterium]
MIFDKLWANRNGHHTDADIRAKIYEAFRSYDTLHSTKPRIEVEVNDGVVTLGGAVCGAGQRGMAEKLAAAVEGVRSVRNELRDDPTIEGAVARAMARHPQVGLSTEVVRIKSFNGVVTLRGPVLNQRQQMAAEAVTRSVPGVIDVVNCLVVIPDGNGHRPVRTGPLH